MGIAGWMARKGAVGGTAMWAAKGYHALIRDNPDGTHFHLLMFLTETRYSSATDSPLKKRLIDLITTDPENRLLKAKFFPGLHRFVVCILTIEAGFEENTLENQRMFEDVIREELLKNGVPKNIIENSNILIPDDDEN